MERLPAEVGHTSMNSVSKLVPDEDSNLDYAPRLERRWAQFFKAVGWAARHRPFAVDGFAPTFVLDFKRPLAVFAANVKSIAEYETIGRSTERLGLWHNEILVVGERPAMKVLHD